MDYSCHPKCIAMPCIIVKASAFPFIPVICVIKALRLAMAIIVMTTIIILRLVAIGKSNALLPSMIFQKSIANTMFGNFFCCVFEKTSAVPCVTLTFASSVLDAVMPPLWEKMYCAEIAGYG